VIDRVFISGRRRCTKNSGSNITTGVGVIELLVERQSGVGEGPGGHFFCYSQAFFCY
jgi:hypothetical protein